MGIVSYAQNFEDVILWRVLEDVTPGFYIDVGAQHPVVDSISKAFYEEGWRGIHVEPTTEHVNLLRVDRPDEVVIQAVVADQSSVLRFYEIPGGGLSTARRDIAENHERNFGFKIIENLSAAITLDDLLDLAPSDTIHWLKIDVEGFERETLLGWRNSPRRPWVLVIEATYPTTLQETYQSWEEIVLTKGYELTYRDGLNRFYLHYSQRDRKERFGFPPNVFDGFQLSGMSSCITTNLVSACHEKQEHLLADREEWHQEAERLRAKYQKRECDAQIMQDALQQLVAQTTARELAATVEHVTKLVEVERAHWESLEAMRESGRQAEVEQAERYRHALKEALNEMRCQYDAERGELKGQLSEVRAELDSMRQAAEARQQEFTECERAHGKKLDALHESWRQAEATQAERHELALQQALNEAYCQHEAKRNELEGRLRAELSVWRQRVEAREQELTECERAHERELEVLHESWRQAEAERSVQFEQSLKDALDDARGQYQVEQRQLEAQMLEQNASYEAVRRVAEVRQHEVVECERRNAILIEEIKFMQKTRSWRWTGLLGKLSRRRFSTASEGLEGQPKVTFVDGKPIHLLRRNNGDHTFIQDIEEFSCRSQQAGESIAPSPTLNEDAKSGEFMSAIHHIDDLLELHDVAFVEAVYQSLLRRQPDPNGRRYYLRRLRDGYSRETVIAQIANSFEGKARGSHLEGLENLLADQRKKQHWFWRLVGHVSNSEHRLNRLKNELGRLAQRIQIRQVDTAARLARIEQLLSMTPLVSQPNPVPPEDKREAPVTSLTTVPALQETESGIKLNANFCVHLADWLAWVDRSMHAVMNAQVPSELISPGSTLLWICVMPGPGDNLTAAQAATQASLEALRPYVSVEVKVAWIGQSPADSGRCIASLADLAPLVAPGDLILCIQSGDELHPGATALLARSGAFCASLTVFDFWFREGDLARPVLLHGADVVHARACDYFHSRFTVRGEVVGMAAKVGALGSPRTLALTAVLGEVAAKRRNVLKHIPFPLLCATQLSNAQIKDLQGKLIHELTQPGHWESAASKSTVSAVVCTKNNGHLLRALVRELLALEEIRDVVIVSNNTSDVHAKLLLDELSHSERCTVLRYDKVFNFSAQCNLGAKHAQGKYLLMINDDIAPVADDWLGALLRHVENNPRCIVGPLLLYPDETVQHGGMYLGFNGCAGHAFRGARVPSGAPMFELVAPRQVSCLTGAVMLMDRRLYADLNGFDPMLATTLQDVDLSLRALFSGATLIFEPRSILLHMESVSVKTTLVEATTQRRREAEYAYFANRWQYELGRDPWFNSRLHFQDETWHWLRD